MFSGVLSQDIVVISNIVYLSYLVREPLRVSHPSRITNPLQAFEKACLLTVQRRFEISDRRARAPPHSSGKAAAETGAPHDEEDRDPDDQANSVEPAS